MKTSTLQSLNQAVNQVHEGKVVLKGLNAFKSDESMIDDLENDWEKKSGMTESRDDLKKLISDVNSISDSLYLDFIKLNFNYSQFVNMLALNIYLANASTYYHNYYLIIILSYLHSYSIYF